MSPSPVADGEWVVFNTETEQEEDDIAEAVDL